jgi:hypothetical protein
MDIRPGPSYVDSKGPLRRWRCHPAVLSGVLVLLLLLGDVIIYGVVFPLLWPYRDQVLVWLLLAFLSGGHMEELFEQTGPRL